MRCRRCVRQATALLRDLPGIATVTADRSTSVITVAGDLADDEVLRALADTTFAVTIIGSSASAEWPGSTGVGAQP